MLFRSLERAGVVERVSEARERAERQEFWVTLGGESKARFALDGGSGTEDVPRKREQRVVQLLLSELRPWRAAELAARAKVPAALLRDMAARGLLRLEAGKQKAEGRRQKAEDITLNPGQESALGAIRELLAARRFSAVLFQGVTGSGKTEVYLRAIEEVLQGGAGALMLVPEIALTPAMAEQFLARFGDTVAILHSGFAGR